MRNLDLEIRFCGKCEAMRIGGGVTRRGRAFGSNAFGKKLVFYSYKTGVPLAIDRQHVTVGFRQ